MPMSDETSNRRKRIDNGASQQKINSGSVVNNVLPWYLSRAQYPVRNGNELTPYLCGAEIFAAVADSIKNAKSSVDIVAWGFDPAMPIVRNNAEYSRDYSVWESRYINGVQTGVASNYSPWRKQDTYGHILLHALRDNPDLRIRVIVWYCRFRPGYNLAGNIIGMPSTSGSYSKMDRLDAKIEKDTGYVSSDFSKNSPLHLRSRHPDAQAYSKQWFDFVRNTKTNPDYPFLDRLAFCFRAIDSTTVREEDPFVGAESTGIWAMPSDHQKMILVDFDDNDKRHGYVMGHNGITCYWSEFPFVHRDVRSEMDFAPYHDFSMRVRGPLLIDMNENFCDAWASRFTFKGTGPLGKISMHERRALEAEDAEVLRANRRQHYEEISNNTTNTWTARGQIVRTLPTHEFDGAQEKEVKDAYLQVTRHAENYIFIVNQYCQYSKLARHIKYWWKQRRDKGYTGNLYIFMGTCKPERDAQVFRAQQMANELGVGLQFPVAEHEMYYDDEDDPRRQRDKNFYENNPDWDFQQGGPESDRTRYGDTMNAEERKIPRSELEAMGIFPVFFMFYTKIPSNGSSLESKLAQQVYVHAKLMVQDDVFMTLGSSNLNIRSMAVDSEMNLITDHIDTAQFYRCNLWKAYCDLPVSEEFPNHQKTLEQDDVEGIYKRLKITAEDNHERIKNRAPIQGLISKFEDTRDTSAIRVG